MLNFMLDQAEISSGTYGLAPRARLVVPQRRVHTGPVAFNNIRVDRSVVGAINTGELGTLDVRMDQIRLTGDPDLADALRDFTQAVIEAHELSDEDRHDILQHLSFLTKPSETQPRSVLKTALLGLERFVANSGSLASLWTVLKPLLEKSLG